MVTRMIGTAFLLCFLVAGAYASSPRHMRCVTPGMTISQIEQRHPDATAHAMSENEFKVFAETMGIRRGDEAYWFVRPGAISAYIVVFLEGCLVGSGQVDRESLPGLMGVHQT